MTPQPSLAVESDARPHRHDDSVAGASDAPSVPPLTAIDVHSATLTVLAIVAVILVLHYAQAMIIPIVLGILISYALDPIVVWLEKLRLPRALAAAALLLGLVAASASLVYVLRFEA